MRGRGALTLVVLLGLTLAASRQVTAEDRVPAGQAPGQPPPAHGEPLPPEASGQKPPAPFPAHQRPLPAPALLDRGKSMYLSLCSACHGADARGGQLGGVNLLRSPVVLGDRDGELVAPIVKSGRPGTAMPPFQLPDADIQAVIAYLHSLQAQGDIQGGPPPGPPVVLNVLVGDAAAGAAYFAKTCASCHSASGDLAGIATRVEDAKQLQNLWVSGGRAIRGPARGPRRPEHVATARVMLPEGVVQGRLVHLDDFLVTVALEDGTTRTIRRTGGTPSVQVDDPLAAHNDLLATCTDANIHDITAYLATLR